MIKLINLIVVSLIVTIYYNLWLLCSQEWYTAFWDRSSGIHQLLLSYFQLGSLIEVFECVFLLE
jgi:hypothetical protein